LIEKYVKEKNSALQIAKMTGHSDYYVYSALKKFGIPLHSRADKK